MSNNLNRPQVAANQAQKEVTINDSDAVLDAAITETLDIDVSAGNVVVSGTTYREAFRYLVTGATVVGRTVTLTAVKRFVLFASDGANTESVDIILGTTTYVLAAGSSALFYSDGTADGLINITADALSADPLSFKGAIDASTNPNYPAADAGHVYKISVAGKIGGVSGPNVEVNDVITCTLDASASGDHATVGANWFITQSNIDGAVIGPASAVDNRVCSFNGITGKVIKDSGILASNIALITNNLSVFAATTSAQLAGVISDETGTGALVFANSCQLVTPNIGAATALSLTLSGNISSAAWTTNGLRIKGVAATLTDTTSTGTVAAAYTDAFGGNTIAASSATTFTNYFTGYFREPTAGTNVTFTNKWALGADSMRIGTSNQLTVTAAGILTAGSPVFTGTPTAPTAAPGTNTTQIATTAFVDAASGVEFTPADQTITAAGLLTLAHGLGTAPKHLHAHLVCQTADLNWVAADAAGLFGFAQGNNQGFVWYADATNIYIKFGSSASVFSMINKTTGASSSITLANWKFRLAATLKL